MLLPITTTTQPPAFITRRATLKKLSQSLN
jgi:hypothetical protein